MVTRLSTSGKYKYKSLLGLALFPSAPQHTAYSSPNTRPPQLTSASCSSLLVFPLEFPSPLSTLPAPMLALLFLPALSALPTPPLTLGGPLWVHLYGDWQMPEQFCTRN